MDYQKVGRYIADCRKKKNMTQRELADKLGVTNKAVSKWETGQGMPDVSVLLDLARALEVSVESILQGGPEEEYSENSGSEEKPPAFEEYTKPSGTADGTAVQIGSGKKRWESFPVQYLLEGAGGILLILGILCLAVQVWYLLKREDYQIEYMAWWMFYAVNGAALLLLIVGGICVRKLRHFFLKPVSVMIFAVLFICNLAALFLVGTDEREIIRISPGLPKNFMVLKINEDNGKARLCRQAKGPFVRRADELPFTVDGAVKTQWLEDDVCAVTYRSEEDGGVHQFAAAYGDRSDGVSYYYVSNAILGTWVGPDGYMLDMSDGKMRLVTPRGTEYYEYDDFMQYGTLALVFPKDNPRWTVVLNKDCILESGETTLEDGGTLTLCRVSMKKTTPVVLKRTMDGGVS